MRTVHRLWAGQHCKDISVDQNMSLQIFCLVLKEVIRSNILRHVLHGELQRVAILSKMRILEWRVISINHLLGRMEHIILYYVVEQEIYDREEDRTWSVRWESIALIAIVALHGIVGCHSIRIKVQQDCFLLHRRKTDIFFHVFQFYKHIENVLTQ